MNSEDLDSAKQVDIGDGTYVAGDVDTRGGNFIGRDKNIYGDHITGDKVNSKTVTYIYNYPARFDFSAEDEIRTHDDIPPCPYRGLFAFRPEDSALFFGREQITTRIVDAITERNFLALVGTSGSGKSSIIYAGVVPRIHQRQNCLIIYFRPSDDPFSSLARALLPLYAPKLSKTDQIRESKNLALYLQSKQISLLEVVASIHDTYPDHRVLLIADQFEELFTLSSDLVLVSQFIDLLLSGLSSELHKSLSIILIIRADFISQASLNRPLADAFRGATEILGPMSPSELIEAIEKPAINLGVSFEKGLTNRILDDVGMEAGRLPLLQFALTEMWSLQHNHLITHKLYAEIGQVSGALSRHADRVYRELTPTDRLLARQIFVQLVKPGQGTQDTRRLATRDEIGASKWTLVTKLASKRLIVTTGREDAEDRAEVIHEALILNWEQLKEWMNEDRVFRIWQERLRNDLNEWLDSNKRNDALMRSYSLAEAKHWTMARPNDISSSEREFIEVSLAKHDREEKQRFLVLVAAIVAIIMLTVMLIFSVSLISTR